MTVSMSYILTVTYIVPDIFVIRILDVMLFHYLTAAFFIILFYSNSRADSSALPRC